MNASPISNQNFYLPETRPGDGVNTTAYFALSVVIAGIAAVVFHYYSFAWGVVLFTVASWCLLTSIVNIANRIAEDTCMAKPIHVLHAIVGAVNSLVISGILFPVTLLKCYHAPRENQEGGIPVLLVNGYLSFGSTWEYIRGHLDDAEIGPVHTMNVWSFCSIEEKAADVKQKLEEIYQETGHKRCIVVGHSNGVLDLLYYVTHLKQPDEKLGGIAIGGPCGGSNWAYMGLGEDARQMRPGSEFLEDLKEARKTKLGDTPIHCIASETDGVVPLESALIEEATSTTILKDLDHLSLLYSERVAATVTTIAKHLKSTTLSV